MSLVRLMRRLPAMAITDHYPAAWQRLQSELNNGRTKLDFRFSGRTRDLTRFANRYRVARSFRCVSLEGYSLNTVGGYSGLIRLFLTWSAFEQFCRITGLKKGNRLRYKGVDQLLKTYNADDVMERVRGYDKTNSFCDFLIEVTISPGLKTSLRDFRNGNSTSPRILAEAVRHSFSHGELTPHAKGKKPQSIKKISDDLSEFFLAVMNSEFSKKVKEGCST